jgi:hypothetical protein
MAVTPSGEISELLRLPARYAHLRPLKADLVWLSRPPAKLSRLPARYAHLRPLKVEDSALDGKRRLPARFAHQAPLKQRLPVVSCNDIGSGFKSMHLQAAMRQAFPHGDHKLLVSDERFATLIELGTMQWWCCIPGAGDLQRTAEEALNASKRQWSLQISDGVLSCHALQVDQCPTNTSIRHGLQKALVELAGKGWELSLEFESSAVAQQGECCKVPPQSDVSTAVGTRLSVDTLCDSSEDVLECS